MEGGKPRKGEANSLLGVVLARDRGRRARVLGPETKEWAGDNAVDNNSFTRQ